MPTANSFKYLASYNTTSGNFYGAGFDGIPVIFEFNNVGEVDVSDFDKYQALSGEQICNFYWNFAGIEFNASAEVPLLEFDVGSPPAPVSNTSDGSVSFNGQLLLGNNDNGEGYDPSERMIAYPSANNYFEVVSEDSGDPWPFTLRISAGVSSVSSIVRLMSNGSFLGYGMKDVCDVEVFATNRSDVGVQSLTKRVIIKSYFETELSDYTFSQRNFGGATFWQAEKEEYVDNSDGTAEDPVYILEDTASLGTINPIFFTY